MAIDRDCEVIPGLVDKNGIIYKIMQSKMEVVSQLTGLTGLTGLTDPLD